MFTQSFTDDSGDDDALSDISFNLNASIISLSNHRTEAYKVITIVDVFRQMDDQIQNISDVMNIPAASARILLEQYNWQSDMLAEKFGSEQERDILYRDAQMLIPRINDRGRHPECMICLENSKTKELQCGHKFCRNCWNQYLTTKIVEYGAHRIPCPDSKCNVIVEDYHIKRLMPDPKVLRKYKRSILNNYVKFKSNLSWCTSPGCNYLIDSIDCLTIFVTCKCGNQFCLECHEQSHSPISCQHLFKWKDDDYDTQSYLSVYTKPCPNCRIAIEKNGGCNHMKCFSCKHEFCWKCLVAWFRHTEYRCQFIHYTNTTARTQLQRLNYCRDRYAYNRQVWKDEIDRFDFAWEQFEHSISLKAALNHIFECRRFLMYSYAFVYYLNESNEVYILEINFDYIEGAVDAVSVLLEDYIRLKEKDADFLNKEAPFRTEIIDKATHCDMLRKKWLKNIEDGKASNTYLYRE
ncbi:hypothetical protein HA402_014923 [Bradysia odoriphaga]|nr:hypothetical protein HA402_014923 [Bradysia odoriphaga]